MTSIKCPECTRIQDADKEMLGSNVVCKYCGHKFTTGPGVCARIFRIFLGTFFGLIVGGLVGGILAYACVGIPKGGGTPHSIDLSGFFYFLFIVFGGGLGAIVGGIVGGTSSAVKSKKQ